MNNHWNYLRFDEYQDVFIEDGHFLYVECTPWNQAYLLACREYRVLPDGTFLVGSWSGADCEYLRSLNTAPHEVAGKIIEHEFETALLIQQMSEAVEELYWED